MSTLDEMLLNGWIKTKEDLLERVQICEQKIEEYKNRLSTQKVSKK